MQSAYRNFSSNRVYNDSHMTQIGYDFYYWLKRCLLSQWTRLSVIQLEKILWWLPLKKNHCYFSCIHISHISVLSKYARIWNVILYSGSEMVHRMCFSFPPPPYAQTHTHTHANTNTNTHTHTPINFRWPL